MAAPGLQVLLRAGKRIPHLRNLQSRVCKCCFAPENLHTPLVQLQRRVCKCCVAPEDLHTPLVQLSRLRLIRCFRCIRGFRGKTGENQEKWNYSLYSYTVYNVIISPFVCIFAQDTTRLYRGVRVCKYVVFTTRLPPLPLSQSRASKSTTLCMWPRHYVEGLKVVRLTLYARRCSRSTKTKQS
jgi:hypothetical protein